jgi:uncharacterized membrane protein YgcG
MMSFHVNWDVLSKRALKIVHKKSMVKKKPGYKFMPLAFYITQHGDLHTNGMLSQGHRPWTLDKVQGVIIPDDPVTFIEFTEEISAIYEQEIGDEETHTASEMGAMQNAIAGSFWAESSGGVSGAIDNILEQPAYPLPSEDAPGFDQLMLAGSASSSGIGMPDTSGVDTAAVPTVKGKGKGKKGKGNDNGKVPESPAKAKGGGGGGNSGGSGGNSGGGNSGGGGGTPQKDTESSKKVKAGRPRRDFEEELKSEVALFISVDGQDPLWWGAQAKTKYKDLESKKKACSARLLLVHDPEESSSLNVVHKGLTIMLAMIDVVRSHGRGSDEFKRIFDLQESRLRLPPLVPDMQMPSHLKKERWQMETSDLQDASVWMRRTSSISLRESGVDDVAAEQSRLWSERLATLIRGSERHPDMQVIYNLDNENDLEETLSLLCKKNNIYIYIYIYYIYIYIYTLGDSRVFRFIARSLP